MDIGKIFSRSWEIMWNNKVLWVFGILAGCGSRSSSTSFSSGSNYRIGPDGDINIPPELRRFFLEMERYFSDPENVFLFVLGAFCIAILLTVVTLLVGSVGRAGLIKGVLQLEEGLSLEGVEALWDASSNYVLRLFGLNLLVGLVLFVGMIVVMTLFILFSIVTLGFGALLICLLLPALLVGGVFISIFLEQANVALVAEDTGVGAALGRSWDILRGNKGNVIGVGVLIFILRLVVMVVFGLVMVFTLVSVFAAITVTGVDNMMGLFWGMAVATLMFGVIFLLFNGVLTTFTGAAWTLTYNGAVMSLAPIGAEAPLLEESEAEQEQEPDDDEGVIEEV